MPAEPLFSDAWLLTALVYGKGIPTDTIGASDAINHAIPMYEEWVHACSVLGERGLIERSDAFIIATPLGEDLVAKCSIKGVGIFRVAEEILQQINRLPVVGTAVETPGKKVFEDAYKAYWNRTRNL